MLSDFHKLLPDILVLLSDQKPILNGPDQGNETATEKGNATFECMVDLADNYTWTKDGDSFIISSGRIQLVVVLHINII